MKPRLRGVLHQYAFFVSLAGGTGLVFASPTQRAQVAAAVYASALAGLFAASALYHRITWSPKSRRWMRRLDHSMIFVLIAGTYTPFALLLLSDVHAAMVLGMVWLAALSGMLLKLAWIDAPKWVTAAVAVAIGWAVVAASPDLAGSAGPLAVALTIAGGVLYTTGALIYALKRPDPVPSVFGYHELFHALVIAAAAVHFLVIARYVLPRG